ncbi:SDR family oxidoreductase [Vreelandella aquamarina]|uniref:SDR family oxidoreductase n=1 Tax=Vreelandella aquamarina TaxID=77097 RepID=UPI00295E7F3B|nr:SDR family oxidoreductase [Halomonas aquamarina]
MNFDITDTSAMREAVAQAFGKSGRIDRVVSNAGYGVFGAAEEATDEQIERQIATNLTGSIQFIRAVLPHLRAQGGGRIVQVSSEGGQIAYPCFSLYHASKWGIEGFVESVAQEVAPWGIDFILAEPGPTATSFGDALNHTEPMPEYESTPAGELRHALATGAFTVKGDALKTVNAIIDAADMAKPPLRLALGSTAYHSIHQALTNRMNELEVHKAVTLAADSDAFIE